MFVYVNSLKNTILLKSRNCSHCNVTKDWRLWFEFWQGQKFFSSLPTKSFNQYAPGVVSQSVKQPTSLLSCNDSKVAEIENLRCCKSRTDQAVAPGSWLQKKRRKKSRFFLESLALSSVALAVVVLLQLLPAKGHRMFSILAINQSTCHPPPPLENIAYMHVQYSQLHVLGSRLLKCARCPKRPHI